ncbi:MAG: ester cyclase [Solirubrobacterales bacterium]|nr:MAG: ester cyclase [Solirubrobacterales bacterium]
MSQSNKDLIVRSFDEVLSTGRLELADQLVHPGYVNHEAGEGGPGGPEGFRQTVTRLRDGFPDLRFSVQDVIGEGDRVVVRGMFEGTHHGSFNGMPATGRRVSVQHIHIFRVQDGMVAEHWACRDDLGALRQLGVPVGGPAGQRDQEALA